MSRPIFLLAILFDVLCLVVFSALLWHGVIPRELGAGLLGAVVGLRARWSSDHHEGPSAWLRVRSRRELGAEVTIVVGGARTRGTALREFLGESALGVLLGWSRVFT